MTAQPSIPGLVDLVEIGRGGFGTVYRATEERFSRRVAVKVIRDTGVGLNVKARFERECLALGRLSGHPNIVAIHDAGTTADGDLYLSMELLGGGSLADAMRRRGTVRPEDVVAWGVPLCGALETAHRAGVVHRDLKPDNVLFSDYGTPKLVDFGIARMRSAYETRSGYITATLNHAPPEIISGQQAGPVTDVYSFASVLHQLLRGLPPFLRPEEDSLAPLVARIVSEEPPDLRALGVPVPLADVIHRAMAKDPAQRPQTALELGREIAAAGRAMGLDPGEPPVSSERATDDAAALLSPPSGPPTPMPAPGSSLGAPASPTPRPPTGVSGPMPSSGSSGTYTPGPGVGGATAAPSARPRLRDRREVLAAAGASGLFLLLGGGAVAVTVLGGEDEPSQTVPPDVPTFEPLERSGTGRASFDLPAGATYGQVRYTYDGSDTLRIDLLDGSGLAGESVAFATSRVRDGSSYFGLSEGGEPARKVQVVADGSWTLRLEPITQADPLTLPAEGDGNRVFDARAGATLVVEADDRIDLYSTRGEKVEQVTSLYSDTSQPLRVPTETSLLIVKGEGFWKITQP